MASKKPDPRTVALNLISEHGKAAFQKLINMFRAGESGTKIGQVYGVTRQRVSQWKNALGYETVTYTVKSDIADLVDPDPNAQRSNNRTLV